MAGFVAGWLYLTESAFRQVYFSCNTCRNKLCEKSMDQPGNLRKYYICNHPVAA